MDKYNKTFLTQVVVRLDFLGTVSAVNNGLDSESTDRLVKLFPIPDVKKNIEQSITVDFKTGESKTTKKETYNYIFYTNDRANFFNVDAHSISMKMSNYSNYSDLKHLFIEAINVLVDKYPDMGKYKRLGLRYINEVNINDGKPLEWKTYISNNLLQMFRVAEDEKTISRAMNLLEMNFGDVQLRFQYGMHNPDYPSIIRKKIYILDYDAYVQTLINTSCLPNLLDSCHSRIKGLFENSILQRLRDVMNGK